MKGLDLIKKIQQSRLWVNLTELDDKTAKGIKISCCVIVSGFLGMVVLSMMKSPPAEVIRKEPVLQVEVIKAEKKDYPVVLSAFGEADSVKTVPIAPEVGGKIIKIHPRLENGEIIHKGELLFKIDPCNYELIIKSGRQRLVILQRSKDLAENEFKRVKQLFEKNRVGTVSGVEAAEKAWLSAADAENRMQQTVDTAVLNLKRCEVRADFTGRLTNTALERGQFVVPGTPVLTLVDDMTLEIHIAIDSGEVRNWLNFKETKNSEWFRGVKQVPCEIRWTETPGADGVKGVLHRIVEYDRKTRTITLAVRTIRGEGEQETDGSATLVDGMFCSVGIPGKTMQDVIRLPRPALSMDNTVYISVNNRLVTNPVSVLRADGDYVYIDGGIDNNDLVVATRLVNPLEKSVLNIINPI